MERLLPGKSLVVIIDMQERLAAAMPAERMAKVARGVDILLEAARLLGARVIVTEQYPKGLGPTLAAIASKLAQGGAQVFEKLSFSAGDVPEFTSAVDRAAPASVIVTGMEAHVCVYQTVRDLSARGLHVLLPVDAVVSRRDEDREAGIRLAERAGAIPTTVETIVFDWLGRAGTEEFRALSKLLR